MDNQRKTNENFKILFELKNELGPQATEDFDEQGLFVSGVSADKVYLEKEIKCGRLADIEQMTIFLNVKGKWKEYKIGEFFVGKKGPADFGSNRRENRDRMIKTFHFSILEGEDRAEFERDLSFAAC